jgi:hypothetical protein
MDATPRKIWNFVWLNLLGVGAMLALFFGVLYGDFLTDGFAAAWAWFSDHQVIMALAASTPFFAALLVGRASAAKARRKRLAEATRKAAEEAAEARRVREARRHSARPMGRNQQATAGAGRAERSSGPPLARRSSQRGEPLRAAPSARVLPPYAPHGSQPTHGEKSSRAAQRPGIRRSERR